jgi:Rod binding domain-containing protein
MSMEIRNQQPVAAQAPVSKDEEQLWQAAKGMEASFVKEMMRAMRKTVPESEEAQNNRGLQIFRGMLDDHYSESASNQGNGVGLAELIVKQVKEMAEQQRARGKVVIRDLNKSDIIGK